VKTALFITGTDTDVGKTIVTAYLARALAESGAKISTQKWVQCGGDTPDISTHDAILSPLNALSEIEYHVQRNPYHFAAPVSPHLAAKLAGQIIDPEMILSATHALSAKVDCLLIEGSGGLLVPLSNTLTQADLIASEQIPTILVVANKVGCINHALLTIEAMRSRKIPIKGLIFNQITATTSDATIDNPGKIAQLSGIPILGEVPNNPSIRDFIPIAKRVQ
jgi:dethiobiotin synthetase